jgi:hypothetical protein
VIHRDIKPGNIMVRADSSEAVLMDLGLAQLTDDTAGRLTRTRQFLGTLRYASPQQVLAVARLDCRTDVYSLGATLWELLTLLPLFGANEELSDAELMERIQREEPERVRRHNPAVPRDLEAIVLRCLEKSPDRRYASAQELAEDLRRFQRGEPVMARPVGSVERAYRWVKRRPAAVLAVLLVLVLLGSSVGGSFLWNLKHQRVNEIASETEVHYELDVDLAELLGVPAKLVRKPKDKKKYLAEGSPPIGPPQMVEVDNHRWCTRYSSLGNLIELTCLGLDDAPALTTKGYHRWVGRHDEKDNLVEEAHFGTRSEPVFRSSDGTFRGVYRYGANHKRIDQRIFGLNGRPINNKAGWAKRRDDYDSSGEMEESTFWKANLEGKLGFWKREDGKQKDKEGNLLVVEIANLTDDGRPQKWPEGYHRRSTRWNAKGEVIEAAYFGLAGEAVTTTWGYHRRVARHDDRGNLLESAHFVASGEPAFRADDGSFRSLYRYDARGNLTRLDFLGANGRPMNSKVLSVARVDFGYGPAAGLTEACLWKADSKGRVHRWLRWVLLEEVRLNTGQVDLLVQVLNQSLVFSKGVIIEHANLTEDGRPQAWPSGHYRETSRLDARRNILEKAFFGQRGDPVVLAEGYHRVVARYDEKGRRLEQATFGVDGRPAFLAEDDSFRVFWTYDTRGNVVEVLVRGPNGRFRNIKSGWAKRLATYDDSGQLLHYTFWKADEKGTLTLWKREEGQ